jgi:hypothetical protein
MICPYLSSIQSIRLFGLFRLGKQQEKRASCRIPQSVMPQSAGWRKGGIAEKRKAQRRLLRLSAMREFMGEQLFFQCLREIMTLIFLSLRENPSPVLLPSWEEEVEEGECSHSFLRGEDRGEGEWILYLIS